MKAKLKLFGIPIGGILFVSAFPALFMYFSNSAEAKFSEILEPLLLFCAMGLVLFLLFTVFTKSPGKSALSAGIFMICFTNFTLIENAIKFVLPDLKYWHTLPIVFVLCLCGIIAVLMFMTEEIGKTCSVIMCIVFGGLTVVNIATGMPGMISRIQTEHELSIARENRIEENNIANPDMPNVYLLIFDEYANFNQMKEYYDYDNAMLENYLNDHNFTISYDSHNESIMTTTILTNLLNLEYVVDNTTNENDKEQLRKQAKIYDLMREHGYNINIVDNTEFLCEEKLDNSTQIEALTASGENLTYLIYHNTPVRPFYTLGTSSFLKDINVVLDYLSSDQVISDFPTFTVGYINFPHTPFIVDENGGSILSSQYFNWADKRYYLGQYKYCTKRMTEILSNILENDPNSIIILQSDHGARASTDPNLFMKYFSMELMNNPLNAVYYQGEAIDEIKDQSTLNTLRLVLSRLWNEEYNVINVPQDTYSYV